MTQPYFPREQVCCTRTVRIITIDTSHRISIIIVSLTTCQEKPPVSVQHNTVQTFLTKAFFLIAFSISVQFFFSKQGQLITSLIFETQYVEGSHPSVSTLQGFYIQYFFVNLIGVCIDANVIYQSVLEKRHMNHKFDHCVSKKT